jgi:hypothetical protein
VLIPRIFHQIWLGPDPFPDERVRLQETWRSHHPGWELRFWTEETLPAELRREEAAERLRAPWERAAAFALEAVWRFGGVYVETDVDCLGSLEPRIESAELFAGLGGAVFGALAGHPTLDTALDDLRLPVAYGAGPAAATIGPALAFPEIELDGVAAHRAPAGPDRDALLEELAAVEAQVRQAEQEAYEWRRRYERAVR